MTHSRHDYSKSPRSGGGGLRALAAIIAAIVALVLGGCASCGALCATPITAGVTASHVSHATQHRPFTRTPTNYGYNTAGVYVRFGADAGLSATVAETYNLNPQSGPDCFGALWGPREIFTLTVNYGFRVH